eukprot:1161756-Pelagomonas_calceolata.AAC.2
MERAWTGLHGQGEKVVTWQKGCMHAMHAHNKPFMICLVQGTKGHDMPFLNMKSLMLASTLHALYPVMLGQHHVLAPAHQARTADNERIELHANA